MLRRFSRWMRRKGRQTCPRRMKEAGPWEYKEMLDFWETRKGYGKMRLCSFCGGVHPDDVIEATRQGAWIEKTTKNYKVYLHKDEWKGRQRKVYLQHFSDEQRERGNAVYMAMGRNEAVLWSEGDVI